MKRLLVLIFAAVIASGCTMVRIQPDGEFDLTAIQFRPNLCITEVEGQLEIVREKCAPEAAESSTE